MHIVVASGTYTSRALDAKVREQIGHLRARAGGSARRPFLGSSAERKWLGGA